MAAPFAEFPPADPARYRHSDVLPAPSTSPSATAWRPRGRSDERPLLRVRQSGWHSKSPAIHAAFAAQCRQDLSYEAILAPIDGFAASVRSFRRRRRSWRQRHRAVQGRGLSPGDAPDVPAPNSPAAVNTLRFDGAEMLGDNTDGAGLLRDLTVNLACRDRRPARARARCRRCRARRRRPPARRRGRRRW
jgi:hypothetical protein